MNENTVCPAFRWPPKSLHSTDVTHLKSIPRRPAGEELKVPDVPLPPPEIPPVPSVAHVRPHAIPGAHTRP